MGLMTSLKSALGLEKPFAPSDAAPFMLGESALAQVERLPEGHCIHVGTRPQGYGRVVTVDEGPRQGPSPEGFPRLTIGDKDLDRLRGLVLEHQKGGWFVSTHLELRARETPNPNGRLYLCNRFLTGGRPHFFDETATAPPPLPAMLLLIPGVRTILLRDNTITVERVADVPWDGIDEGVNGVLRTYLLGTGHRLADEVVDASGLLAEVQKVLEATVLPAIHRDGGDMQLLGVEGGVVRVRLQGACRSCPASSATLKLGVQRTLVNAFPGVITSVENVP